MKNSNDNNSNSTIDLDESFVAYTHTHVREADELRQLAIDLQKDLANLTAAERVEEIVSV